MLGKISDTAAVNALIFALKDEVSYVRLNAIDALGKIGDKTAVDALIFTLTDKFSYVRSSAIQAIEKIDLKYLLCPN